MNIKKIVVILLLIIAVGGIFIAGVRVGYQYAYRDEHHLYSALMLDFNRTFVKEDPEGFLINRFYETGLLCPKDYAQGQFHDYGCSTSKAPKGKSFDVGSNQELYEEYKERANKAFQPIAGPRPAQADR